jgi:hypothetical protein
MLHNAIRFAIVPAMGKRRSDADGRRFFDEFEKIRVSRFRAMGVIDPARREALIPMGGKTRLMGVKHTRFPNGGGWSYFVCPRCARRAATLYLVEDAPRCVKCCNALNIHARAKYGFGRGERRRASDKGLDELIAKVETTKPLRLKPALASWRGRRKLMANSHSLLARVRRSMIVLRLQQIATQQASERAGKGDVLKTYQPSQPARQLVNLKAIWRAPTSETLQRALDKAQCLVIEALNSADQEQRQAAARLMMRTKQARERGA